MAETIREDTTIGALIEDLDDGDGLIITDSDLIQQTLVRMGFGWDTIIEIGEPGDMLCPNDGPEGTGEAIEETGALLP